MKAYIEAGTRGIVVHGYAFNGAPAIDQRPTLERISLSGIPVVLASRGARGRIPVVSESPFVQGDTLPAHKARILLMLALTKGSDPQDIQRIFNEY